MKSMTGHDRGIVRFISIHVPSLIFCVSCLSVSEDPQLGLATCELHVVIVDSRGTVDLIFQ